MLKWVTVLCLMMYATLMIFGGEGPVPDTEVVDTPTAATPTTEVQVATETPAPTTAEPAATVVEVEAVAEPTIIPSAQPAHVVQTSIASIAPVAEPITSPPAAQAATLPEPAVTSLPPARTIYTVTGSRVNLRSEPNTQAPVVGRAVRGETAEVIELLGNGWAFVYIIDTGIEAFISANFISPES
ncbi:MAG: SH3 domain-containing protein [Litoreibacter sp.]